MTGDEMPGVLRELFAMLPPAGTEWPLVERLRWLHAFEAACRLVFKDDAIIQITHPIKGTEDHIMTRSPDAGRISCAICGRPEVED